VSHTVSPSPLPFLRTGTAAKKDCVQALLALTNTRAHKYVETRDQHSGFLIKGKSKQAEILVAQRHSTIFPQNPIHLLRRDQPAVEVVEGGQEPRVLPFRVQSVPEHEHNRLGAEDLADLLWVQRVTVLHQEVQHCGRERLGTSRRADPLLCDDGRHM